MPTNNSSNSYGSFIGGSFLLVDPNHPNAADDSNRGTPFLTLTGATAVAVATDTIYLTSGSYSAPVGSIAADCLVGIGRCFVSGTLLFERADNNTSICIQDLDLATGGITVDYESNTSGKTVELIMNNCVGPTQFQFTESGSVSYQLSVFVSGCDFETGFTLNPTLPDGSSNSEIFITGTKFDSPTIQLVNNNISLNGCFFGTNCRNIVNANIHSSYFPLSVSVEDSDFYSCVFESGCTVFANTLASFTSCYFGSRINTDASITANVRLISSEINCNTGSFCIFKGSGATLNVSKASVALTGSVTATDISSLTTLTAL